MRKEVGLVLRNLCLACAVTILAVVTPARADTAQEQLRQFVATVAAADGAFVQTQLTDGTTRTQSGVFAFQRPGKFRWEVRQPYAQLVLSDGVHVFQYDPDLAQVIERSLDASLGASPAAILFGKAQLDEAFAVSALPDADGLAWLRAQPRETDAGFTHVDMGFRDGFPARLLLLDVFGQTTRIELNNMQVHAGLPPATFQFDAPAGVDVVRMP